MMTCKIAGCTGDIYRAHLCLACYDFWKMRGVLPMRASERAPAEPVANWRVALEAALEAEQRKVANARQKAQDIKEQRDRAQADVARLVSAAAAVACADDLARVAAALPDVVKTIELRRALSSYRKARQKATR